MAAVVGLSLARGSLQSLLSFGLVAGLLTLVPGIDTALVLRSSLAGTRGFCGRAGPRTRPPLRRLPRLRCPPPPAISWLTFLIFGASFASKWLKSVRSLRIIDLITGTVLIGFGLRLSLEPRHRSRSLVRAPWCRP